MWLIPVFVCVQRLWWRFLLTWLVYSAYSTVIWYRATRPQISGTTPRSVHSHQSQSPCRFVYKWFLWLHKLSYILGIAGYLVIMGTLLGINVLLRVKPTDSMDVGIMLLFYGLYYGVLGRDFAHICTDRMACKIGVRREGGAFERYCIRGLE